MRKFVVTVALLTACTAAPPPVPTPATPPPPAAPHGLTIEEEARILAMEDRRELDAATIDAWAAHPNVLHRQRIALALGRIGPHVFVDANNNNERDAGEKQGGVDQLIRLATDNDAMVRTTVAFALGEIGDATSVDTLVTLASDANATTAAEAAEALSKLTKHVPLARYAALAQEGDARAEGVRARAIRHLYRFNTDQASALAAAQLDSRSTAIRTEAAYALARRAYAPARAALELLMSDPATLIRAYAATALGRIGASESAPLLVTTLGDAHPWVRTNAVIALGRIAAKDASIIRAEDLPRVFAALEDPDPGVRASTIDTLGHYAARNETARRRLTDVSVNGTRWERELAAGAIARNLGESALPAELSSWAKVRVLEAGLAPMRRRWASDPDALVRYNVISNIPDAQVDAELELIRAALGDADVIVRANALDRYGKSTSEPLDRKLATLREAASRRDPINDARAAAIAALIEIDHPEREAFLRGLLADDDFVVRRMAADAIEQKLGRNRPQYAPLPVTGVDYNAIVAWSRQPHTATIHMTRGIIELALLTAEAPMTTWNFAQLARRKYFDNTSFMRVVPNFVVQGGDPRNDMNGGPGYSIRDEINLQKYTRGAVGMALSGPDTGGSQFFITHSPQPHLDGGYTIFARVYEGMNGVVDQTERGDRVETITIDEHPPVGQSEISSLLPVSLPLEVGATDAARLLARVPEYADRKSAYKPDISVVEMMKSYVRAGDRVEVFMGTWCDDSQREVPKFLRILDDLDQQYGVKLPVTFVAVDRSKQQPAALLAGKSLQKVATFIYFRGDRELGRIVERPQGLFEDDLLAIAARE